MATKVHMEALSPTMEEGQLVRWLKHEGDTIAEGDVLAEIETDKATMELVARGSGVLQGIKLQEGATAPVGDIIAMIGEAGEAAAAGADSSEAAAKAAPEAAAKGAPEAADEAAPKAAAKAAPKSEAAGTEAPTSEFAQKAASPAEGAAQKEEPAKAAGEGRGLNAGAVAVSAAGETEKPRTEQTDAPAGTAAAARPSSQDGDADTNGRVRASPLARRLATEAGLDIGDIEGSGPGGRITKRDIEATLKDGPTPKAEAAAGTTKDASAGAAVSASPSAAQSAAQGVRLAPAARASEGAESEEVPISQMRKTIAKRLVQSIGPIPTFYLTRDIDMTRVMDARARINQRLEKQGVKVSVNDIIIKAVGAALVRHPEVNASWGETSIKRYLRAHIGVAVAVEDGLITPIVRDADSKSVAAIAAEVREMAGRAREKKLKPEEYTGATFSISNLGMFGIDEFTAIINPPESAILAIGAVEDRVVAVNGAPAVQPRMKITMSCDHRVIDGASGARFLQTLADLLEEPLMILV